jgi:hypothetical protein
VRGGWQRTTRCQESPAAIRRALQESHFAAIADNGTWADWIKVLDSPLLEGPQPTFVGVAVLEHMAVGVCAGNSRAYLLDRNGECRILLEGAANARLGSGNAEAFPVRQALKTGETLLLLSDGAWTPFYSFPVEESRDEC